MDHDERVDDNKVFLVQRILRLALGEEDAAAHSWYVQLAGVVANLGIDSTAALTNFLGEWRARAPQVTRRMREEKPWANSALVFDMLLRLAEGDRYRDSGCSNDDWERTDERAQGFFDELTPYAEVA